MKYEFRLSAYKSQKEYLANSVTYKAMEWPEDRPCRIIEADSEEEALEKYLDLYGNDIDPFRHLRYLEYVPMANPHAQPHVIDLYP